jgi:hypothetical protein
MNSENKSQIRRAVQVPTWALLDNSSIFIDLPARFSFWATRVLLRKGENTPLTPTLSADSLGSASQ